MPIVLKVSRFDRSVDVAWLLEFPAPGPNRQGDRFYWASPEGEVAIAGLGAVCRLATRGADRLVRLANAMRRVSAGAIAVGDPSPDPLDDLVFVGGFAFGARLGRGWGGFAPGEFVVPRMCVVKDARGTRLIQARSVPLAALSRQGEPPESDDPAAIDAVVAHLSAAPSASQATEWPIAWHPAAGRPTDSSIAWSAVRSAATTNRLAAERAAAAIGAIGRGEVVKVVVAVDEARRATGPDDPIDPMEVLRKLRHREPGAYHYLVTSRRGHTWLGATPEQLVRVMGRRVEAMALAGTAARGPNAAEDEALAAALMGSEKDRREHQVVVEMIRSALPGTPHTLPALQAAPRIRRLATLQHLETRLESRLNEPAHVLDVAARLHPTPALAGMPRQAALDLIAAIEGDMRGWYGGAVGWANGRGDGELAVAIRGLRLIGNQATAFAGAGIVAGSEPRREAAEIRRKLDGIWRLAGG